MAHGRQQIRDAAVTIATGLTTTGARVFDSKVYPYEDADLPCWTVFIREDEMDDEQAEINGRQVRRIVIEWEGRSKKASGLEDELDTMAAELEAAIGADPTLGGRVRYLESQRTEIEFSGEQEKPLGVIRVMGDATYAVLQTDPETLLPV